MRCSRAASAATCAALDEPLPTHGRAATTAHVDEEDEQRDGEDVEAREPRSVIGLALVLVLAAAGGGRGRSASGGHR